MSSRISTVVRSVIRAASTSMLVAAMPLGMHSALAAGFILSSNSSVPQTLTSGTGTINQGVTLSVSSDNDAVLVTGSSTLANDGSILQSWVQVKNDPGSSRGVRVNTANVVLTFTNGSATNSAALVQAQDNDAFQVNKGTDSVTLFNYGTFNSINQSAGGAQAIDWNAITTGANTLYNYASGVLTASEADAVRPGVNGFVYNDGLIKSTTSTGSSSDGIDAQTNTGITIVNANTAASGLIEGGRHGITGGNTAGTGAYAMSITNNLGGTIQGDNGSGINIDGINGNELVTIVNNGTISGNGHNIGDGLTHDGDGVDVDGLVNLTNTGTIRSVNAYAPSGIEFSEGVTVGGGTIVNSGTIEGSVAAGTTSAIGRGITIAGVDKDPNGNAIPVQAPYAATTITNSGLIKGDTDSAIIFSSALAMTSGLGHTINNLAGGLIQTGSSTAPAILTAADPVTINNSGTIDGTSSSKAISGGSAALTVNISGGVAKVLGDINGGSSGASKMTLDPGSSGSFAYAGSISNFSVVETKSGNVTLSGANTYSGATKVSGGTLTLDGANRIDPSSALVLNGGALTLQNAGGASGETFASLSLTGSSLVDLGLSSLSFNALGALAPGVSLTITDWSAAASPGYAYRILGNDTGNASFLALVGDTTIDGLAANYLFDGTYTDVAPVPLPPGVVSLLSGLGLLAVVGYSRRRQEIRPTYV